MSWYKKAFKQEKWEYGFGDYQRWIIDAYEVKVHLTEVPKKFAVSLTVSNLHDAGIVYQQFWKYSKSDGSRARSTFDSVVKVAKEVVDIFTKGDDEQAPNNLIASHLRTLTWDIDRDGLAKTNIPTINYAIDKGEYESDWRSQIYGKRYPTGQTDGY